MLLLLLLAVAVVVAVPPAVPPAVDAVVAVPAPVVVLSFTPHSALRQRQLSNRKTGKQHTAVFFFRYWSRLHSRRTLVAEKTHHVPQLRCTLINEPTNQSKFSSCSNNAASAP